jgi:hypothetical protein
MSSPLHQDDTNQFGPGTDLMISLVAVLLVLTVITSQLYSRQKARVVAMAAADTTRLRRQSQVNDSLRRALAALATRDSGGTFRVAEESFPAGEFRVRPVTQLLNLGQTEERVARIVDGYRRQSFPYIFVIGHSSAIDDPTAQDHSRGARLQRNWEYANRRAVVIAALIEARLTGEESDRLVVMTTGELDLRNPDDPLAQENAWVEVVFGKEWKPPSRLAPR